MFNIGHTQILSKTVPVKPNKTETHTLVHSLDQRPSTDQESGYAHISDSDLEQLFQ